MKSSSRNAIYFIVLLFIFLIAVVLGISSSAQAQQASYTVALESDPPNVWSYASGTEIRIYNKVQTSSGTAALSNAKVKITFPMKWVNGLPVANVYGGVTSTVTNDGTNYT